MEARAQIVESMQDNPGGDLMTAICGEHADYIWEIKARRPDLTDEESREAAGRWPAGP